MHLLLGDFDLAAHHVRGLFSVERVRDTSNDEHVDLHAASSFLLVALAILVAETRVWAVTARG